MREQKTIGEWYYSIVGKKWAIFHLCELNTKTKRRTPMFKNTRVITQSTNRANIKGPLKCRRCGEPVPMGILMYVLTGGSK